MRSYQRTAALWISGSRLRKRGLDVPKEALRDVCRQLKIYDVSIFSYYMADTRELPSRGGGVAEQWFSEVRKDGKVVGWRLTADGDREARKFKGLVK